MVLADEACASSPHDLRGLLAALGLPIASARMPRHVERSILAHTPSAIPLTPALVRAHLIACGSGNNRSSVGVRSGGSAAGLERILLHLQVCCCARSCLLFSPTLLCRSLSLQLSLVQT